MCKIKKIIELGSCILLSLLYTEGWAQFTSNGLQSLKIVPQQTWNNPAFIAPYNVYIGLPILSGVHAQLNNNFLAYNRLIERDINDSLRFNIDKLLNKLEPKNLIGVDLAVDLLNVGFKVKKNYFSFGANLNVHTDLLLTKNTLNFLGKGPAVNLGNNNLSGNSFDFKGYLSIYLGYARQINDDLSVGIRLKYLNGLYDFTTKKMNVHWHVHNGDMEAESNETPYYYVLNVDGDICTNLPIDSNLKINGFNPMDNLFKNHGFGVDLGINYTFADNWNVNFSVLDLGFIKWKQGVSNWTSRNANIDYKFSGLSKINIGQSSGINIDSMANTLITEVLDTLGFEYESNKAYTTPLAATFVLGVGYTLYEKHQFTALFKGINRPHSFQFECGVAYTYTPSKNFAISVNNTFKNSSWLNLGIALAGNIGPIQIYLLVDRINSFKVVAMKTLGVQAGINILLGKQEIYESVRQRKRNDIAAEKNMGY
ncbi:MAG: DUF5723 family protein [Bacteroidales bacterium]